MAPIPKDTAGSFSNHLRMCYSSRASPALDLGAESWVYSSQHRWSHLSRGGHSSAACVGTVFGLVSLGSGLPYLIGTRVFLTRVLVVGSVRGSAISWTSHYWEGVRKVDDL